MISIIRFAIIFSVFAFGNCEDEQNNKKIYLLVPIRVRREPPDTVEFQFNQNVEIEPISLKANEVNFQLSEENNVKKFRNTTPFIDHQNRNQAIKINLEYREPGKAESKVQPFLLASKPNRDEVITVRIDVSLPKSGNPMENVDRETIVVPTHSPPAPDVKNVHRMSMNKDLYDDFGNSCENDDGYADKLLNIALRHSKIGTHLLLKGIEDTSLNPVDTIREIIATKLELPHLEYKISQAKFVDAGLLFETESSRDVVEILAKKDAIQLINLEIEPTTKTIFDMTLDVRSGF